MKQVLKVLILGLIWAIFILGLFVIANLQNKEPIEKVQTRTVLAETITKDLAMIDFSVMYEGIFPEYSEYAVKSIVRQMLFEKNILEVLKQNSLQFIEDTLEYKITPIDSAFEVLSIETKYYLRPEVQELWDEYVNARIEAYKAEEKARNLKILYGELVCNICFLCFLKTKWWNDSSAIALVSLFFFKTKWWLSRVF